MATFDYASIRDNKVKPAIERFGQTITITRNENLDDWEKRYNAVEMRYEWYNSTTLQTVYTEPAETIVTYSGQGVLTDFSNEEIDDTNILRQDKKILTIELPEGRPGDKVTVAETDYGLVNTRVVSPGGVDVLYIMQVRV